MCVDEPIAVCVRNRKRATSRAIQENVPDNENEISDDNIPLAVRASNRMAVDRTIQRMFEEVYGEKVEGFDPLYCPYVRTPTSVLVPPMMHTTDFNLLKNFISRTGRFC